MPVCVCSDCRHYYVTKDQTTDCVTPCRACGGNLHHATLDEVRSYVELMKRSPLPDSGEWLRYPRGQGRARAGQPRGGRA